jgi:uncharacterized protein (TIGR02391 family)
MRLIGNIFYRSKFSLPAINQLFISHGADERWFTDHGIPHPSDHFRRAYSWIMSIEKYARDQTLTITRGVLVELSDSNSIATYDDKVAARNLIQKIDLISGKKTSYQWHPRVIEASAKRFHDGHYKDAVREAFVALIDAVRKQSNQPSGRGSQDKHAMIQAFRVQDGLLRLSDDANVQEGYQQLFAGSVMAIRNPLSHVAGEFIDKNEAIECLAFASLLFRYLDRAQQAK